MQFSKILILELAVGFANGAPRMSKEDIKTTGMIFICRHQDYSDCRNTHEFDLRQPDTINGLGGCNSLDSSDMDNAISSYSVLNPIICCAFYDDGACTPSMALFLAKGRRHGKLDKTNNDRISSYKCMRTCDGLSAP